MSRETNVTAGSTGGVSFIGLLQITFIVLKLCGVVDWSWLWVLCPLWGSAAIFVIFLIIVIVFIKKCR